MKRILKLMAVGGAIAALGSAQGRYQERVEERHATLLGARPDGGKCTIEVNVDDVAEVEIAWDLAKLHTLSGGPAQWRRFECTSPLPPNVADFRFTGVDGRGRQVLSVDPRNNHGLAVIRIEDPRSGREGYTFDIEWRGAAPPPPPPVGRDGDRDRDRDRDRGPRLEADRAIAMCQDAVRDRAGRDYGFRDMDFRRVAFDDNPGRRDYVVGTFVARGRDRDRGDEYSFSCSVDFDGRRIRDVEIRRRDRDR